MPTLTPLQKQTAQAIVNVFETGRVRGDYGSVTLFSGDTGHLTYGRSQTTLGSGNLALLIADYCRAPGAADAANLRPYLSALDNCDVTLDGDATLKAILVRAGADPIMRSVQDSFFDRVYWEPAMKSADYIGASTALGCTIVYDSRIHGSWHRLRDETSSVYGVPQSIGEEAWFSRYVDRRNAWLANSSNPILRQTTYRMATFRTLMNAGSWSLPLPVVAHGVTIDLNALSTGTALPTTLPIAPSRATEPAHAILKLKNPHMSGDVVVKLQNAIAESGIAIKADGDFGPDTDKAVRDFQNREGLKSDGIVGPATWARLDP